MKRIEKTEPYGSYDRALNGIYDYYKVIFNKKTEEEAKYERSLEEMSKRCDCKNYVCKDEKRGELKDAEYIEGESEIERGNRMETGMETGTEREMKRGIILKNEYIE